MAGYEITSLDEEAFSITENAPVFKIPTVLCTIYTEAGEIELNQINDIHYIRKFNVNITDAVHIEFPMGLGTFREDIYQYRENLEISIRLTINGTDFVSRYKFIPLNKIAGNNDSSLSKVSKKDLDKQEMLVIKGQCVDSVLLSLKYRTTSGCYHGTTVDTLIKGHMGRLMSDIKDENSTFKYNLNVYKPDNEKEYNNIFIQPFSKAIKIPYLLQQGDYGVYNTGLGMYFTSMDDTMDTVYDIEVYPLFDSNRFDIDTKRTKLLLINPSMKGSGKNEQNFFYQDGLYKTIVTEVEFKDDKENAKYADGTGLITTVSDMATNDNYLTIGDDLVSFNKDDSYSVDALDKNIRSFHSLMYNDQDANTFKYNSRLNKNQGTIGVINIPNVNPECIYPGMPFKYYFNSGNDVGFTTGIIQSVDYSYDFINGSSSAILVGWFKTLRKDKSSEE